MNQKDKVNVMNKTTYRYHINCMGSALMQPDITLPEAA